LLLYAILVLLGLLAIGVPVAAALGILGLTLSQFFAFMPLDRAIAEIVWQTSVDFLLVAIPLFVLMGELLVRAGIAKRVYDAIAAWLSWLPGGLMHANIGTCALFAANSGSSVATAATIGTVAVPEMAARGYGPRLFLGSIAAGGTLGILIPPSINLIIFGLLTNTSVPKLYLAGFLPGFLLAFLFMLLIAAISLARPGTAPKVQAIGWAERFAVLPDLLPPLLLFLAVIGSIYAGIATPTEAASIGVVVATILGFVHGDLDWRGFLASLEGTMKTTAMIMIIIMAASFLNFIIGAVGLTRAIFDVIESLGLTPYQTLFMLIAIYLVLGFFMETLSMLVITTPIVAPVMAALGFDLIWFGILMTLLLELALITPPVGVNLYVVQSVRTHGPMSDVILGAVPFVLVMLLMVGLLIAFPDIALWLPTLVG
jgi:tripartite ATP-independent transporter DctM subunit